MQERIKQAFSDLREARTNLHSVSELELEAKEDLKSSECSLLAGDRITGKNAEIREAQLRTATFEEREALEKARQRKAQAQLQMDLAVMECDEIKWTIRAEFNELGDT